MIRKFLYPLSTLFSVFLFSCGTEPEDGDLFHEQVTGFVQKGPFINGTQIFLSELNDNLEQTGKIFSTQISNDQGLFTIDNVELSAGFVELSASGYYYNEVQGKISDGTLNLFALSDLNDSSSVNVNILTHLEKQRIDYLLKNTGMDFVSAKTEAQSNILSIFGFQSEEILNSESLNITSSDEGNAILLAISIIIQGNKSVGELTELLSNISNDISKDGHLDNTTILFEIRNTAMSLDLESIRENLINRLEDLGIVGSIPNFEFWVTNFLENNPQPPTISTVEFGEIQTHSVSLTAEVQPNNASTSVHFEYGLTNTFGTVMEAEESPVNGHTSQQVSINPNELSPGTKYYFKVVAENSEGLSESNEFTFQTLGSSPTITSLQVDKITGSEALLSGYVHPNHLNTSIIFEYGETTEFENTVIYSGSIEVDSNNYVNTTIEVLEPGKTYYFRIVAENELGLTTSQNIQFETKLTGLSGTLTDYDGNTYQTIGIDNKVWMAENLKVTSFSDGTPLELVVNNSEWIADPYNSSRFRYSYYDNDQNSGYGVLYSGFAARRGSGVEYPASNPIQGVCPTGWHLPTVSEIEELFEFISSNGYEGNDGKVLKSKSGWSNDGNGTDIYDFSAFPGGVRDDGNGAFHSLGEKGSWWCTDGNPDGYSLRIESESSNAIVSSSYFSPAGLSVRCVKDE